MRQNTLATIACRFDDVATRPTGFVWLQIILSLNIALWHSVLVSDGNGLANPEILDSPWRPLLFFRLPMFFALSGFLVCASAERCRTLISFGLLRLLRILPALAVEVAISALLLGPLLTTLRLNDYFSSATMHTYLLSAVGWIQFELPGVFTNNPCPDMVNLSLWTIRLELVCYVILVLVLMTRNAFGGHVLTALIAGLQIILLLPFLDTIPNEDVIGPQLSLSFLVGAALYIHRRRIIIHWSLALAALAATVLLLELPGGISLVPLPAAYVTVYIGLLTPQLPKILKTGDYSYGIYLYSFPIQQVVATQAWTHTWWINALISLPLTLLAAAASYHFLERRMAALKPHVRRLEDGLFHRSNPFKRLRPWLRLTSRRRIRYTRVVRNTA